MFGKKRIAELENTIEHITHGLREKNTIIEKLTAEKDARWDVIAAAAALNMENMLRIAALGAVAREAYALIVYRSEHEVYRDGAETPEYEAGFRALALAVSKARRADEGTGTPSAGAVSANGNAP
jgi:hypothetical protein